ncbi:hypothetical protein GQ600_22699 [Phytophthora cactorum]|nr:hypothetical protein GQ600_22699 [Phytophthora cactorum]
MAASGSGLHVGCCQSCGCDCVLGTARRHDVLAHVARPATETGSVPASTAASRRQRRARDRTTRLRLGASGSTRSLLPSSQPRACGPWRCPRPSEQQRPRWHWPCLWERPCPRALRGRTCRRSRADDRVSNGWQNSERLGEIYRRREGGCHVLDAERDAERETELLRAVRTGERRDADCVGEREREREREICGDEAMAGGRLVLQR